MKVAIYARVSTKDKGQETENQLLQLRDYCKRMEWNVSREFIDNVTASGECIREQWDLMFSEARQKKFDLVLFWSLDRFSREGVEATLFALRDLNHYKVNWKSYTEQYLDSTGIFKEAVIAIIATVAKQERIRISERTKAGMETARLKGVVFGRKKVTDIDRSRKGRKAPTANVEEIRTLRAEGKSLRQIEELTGISKDSVARLLSQKPSSSVAV